MSCDYSVDFRPIEISCLEQRVGQCLKCRPVRGQQVSRPGIGGIERCLDGVVEVAAQDQVAGLSVGSRTKPEWPRPNTVSRRIAKSVARGRSLRSEPPALSACGGIATPTRAWKDCKTVPAWQAADLYEGDRQEDSEAVGQASPESVCALDRASAGRGAGRC